MLTTLGALAPVFLMIALGWLLRRRRFLRDAFWPDAERLVYWVLFPALLFLTTAGSDLAGMRVLPVAAALVLAVLATAGAALALRRWIRLPTAGFTSVFQGAIRTNAYVGLAGAGALYGEAGLAITGPVVFVVISLVNLLSVGVLVHFGVRPASLRETIAALARNPLILACVAGFVCNVLGLRPAGIADATLEIMARASLALGLLCVGAALDLSRLATRRRAALAAGGLKLLVMPVATALFCRLLGVEGITAAVAILFTSVPVSASSYVLARQLGGDAELLAALITLTTLAAAVTMPLVLALLT